MSADAYTKPRLELLSVVLLERIFALACTDGGSTGSALSLVSKTIRKASSTTRYHSVSLLSARQLNQFSSVFDAQCHLNPSRRPTLAHLLILSPFSKTKRLSNSYETEIGRATYAKLVESLMSYVAPQLETLCLIECTDAPNLWDILLPLPAHPTQSITFPRLRELMLVGSGVSHHGVASDSELDTHALAVFPQLSHLQLVATTISIFRWSSLAPKLARMRVTDHDVYGIQQVMRTSLLRAVTACTSGCTSLPLPAPHAPETVFIVMDAEAEKPVSVMRYTEPRVVRSDSDWEEIMRREWLERIGGGSGIWMLVGGKR